LIPFAAKVLGFCFLKRRKMQVEKHYKERYRKGDTPWGVGKPDFNLDAETVRGSE
jgi:hypothetical protein